MSSILVIGGMWGDEAKAKVVDYLAAGTQYVVRFQGGSNAGHTIVTGGKKYVFHSIPSGILYPDVTCYIGMGVVIEPQALLDEIKDLETQGLQIKDRLVIDFRAGLVLPLHKELDTQREQALGKGQIGTTQRGIGPAYSDLTARVGLRFEDLRFPAYVKERLQELYDYHHRQISEPELELQVSSLLKDYAELVQYEGNVEHGLARAYLAGDNILFEGAQGTLLDTGFGSYPYVTSSRVMTDAVGTGTGFSARRLDMVLGVFKAYCTRVGEGPMPTEIRDNTAEIIREKGHEYGSTTGRPRRIGWFDAVAGSHSADINDMSRCAITCLDVLSGIEKLKICVGYKYKGIEANLFELHHLEMAEAVPVYETFHGWDVDISNCRSIKKLPKTARTYLEAMQDHLGLNLYLVSVGRDRGQTFYADEEN